MNEKCLCKKCNTLNCENRKEEYYNNTTAGKLIRMFKKEIEENGQLSTTSKLFIKEYLT